MGVLLWVELKPLRGVLMGHGYKRKPPVDMEIWRQFNGSDVVIFATVSSNCTLGAGDVIPWEGCQAIATDYIPQGSRVVIYLNGTRFNVTPIEAFMGEQTAISPEAEKRQVYSFERVVPDENSAWLERFQVHE